MTLKKDSDMPTGRLKAWVDDRGFGFLKTSERDGGDTFVHISTFRTAGLEPVVGDAYWWAEMMDDNRKWRAVEAECVAAGGEDGGAHGWRVGKRIDSLAAKEAVVGS